MKKPYNITIEDICNMVEYCEQHGTAVNIMFAPIKKQEQNKKEGEKNA